MPEIKYRYAYDNNNNIVDINELSEETRTLHTYVCVGCGNKILPRAMCSEYRRAHFYHKEHVECSGETYLHKLAKQKIKNKFDSSQEFIIQYSINVSCSELKCKIRNADCANRKKTIRFDLKKHYNKCEVEKEIIYNGNKYIADLLLTNEENNNYPPMLIEICVSHPCEAEKMYSWLQILEINIKDEQSLIDLVDAYGSIAEGDDVKLYGVERNKYEKQTRYLSRFYHIPNRGVDIKPIDCGQVEEVLNEESDIEVNIFNELQPRNDGICIQRDVLENYLTGRYFIEDCKLCAYREDRTNYEIEEHQLRPVTTKYCHFGLEQPYEDLSCFKRRKCDVAYDLSVSNYSFNVIKDSRKHKEMFYVAIAASDSFYNYEYVEQKFIHFLDKKLKECNVVLTAGATNHFSGATGYMMAEKLSEKLDIPFVGYEADWNKDGKRAAHLMNLEMLKNARALIYFWNGTEKDPKYIVKEAKKQKIPVRVIDFSKEKKLCPLCGGRLYRRQGKYGYFYGCCRYPECSGKKDSIE